jgi:hypothetical protein
MKGGNIMTKQTLAIMAFAIIALLGVSMVSAHGMGEIIGLSEEEIEEFQSINEDIRTAVQEENYADWEAAMQERVAMVEEQINEDTFNSIVEKHNDLEAFKEAFAELRESGEVTDEAVQELMDEYGIEHLPFKMRMQRWFHNMPRPFGHRGADKPAELEAE